MNKKVYFLFVISSFIVNLSFSQNDSIILRNLKCHPDTMINGIQGIAVSYNATLGYDTTFHRQKNPTATKLKFKMVSNNKEVSCTGNSYKYCDKNQYFSYSKEIRYTRGKIETILIPYYILKLNQGLNTAKIEVSALMSDTSIFESAFSKIKIVGETNVNVQFTKPPLEEFSVLVSGVKFMDTDFKGKAWDYNLISGAAPDICWKVEVGANDNYESIFRSSVMKNAYSAAWLDWAEDISLSVGDKFCIGVYDDDPMSDDFAGSICGTLSQIIEKSTKKQPMAFGRLTYFTFMITAKE